MDGCELCGLLAAEPGDRVVLCEGGWTAMVYPDHEVPGSIVAAPTRHVRGITGLTRHEAAEYGLLTWRLAQALQRATGSDHVYVAAFGETMPHFHFLVASRPLELPSEWQGPAYLLAKEQMIDPAAAVDVAAATRRYLADEGNGTL